MTDSLGKSLPSLHVNQRISKSSKINPNSLNSIREDDSANNSNINNSFSNSSSKKIPTVRPETNNARDELVLIFFSSMLDSITESWYIVPEKSVYSIHPVDISSDTVLKDFKTISYQDLTDSDVTGASGFDILLSLKRRGPRSSSSKKTCVSMRQDADGIITKESVVVSEALKNLSSNRQTEEKKSSKSFRLPTLPLEVKSISLTSEPKLLGQESDSRDMRSDRTFLQPLVSHNFQTSFLEYMQNLKIKFKNGNIYQGNIKNKLMHGEGVYYWADGTVYIGDFKKGTITGKGKMIFSDLSWYEGDFCNGYREGNGVMHVMRTPLIYNGGWRAGKFHGKGWLLYDVNDWYDGEWKNGQKHGHGLRQYDTGGIYKGDWRNDKRDGMGSMLWHNNDFYKGDWSNNLMHGYGEYSWNSIYNTTMTYPLENMFEGWWKNGMRDGPGVMNFGIQLGGCIMNGYWMQNCKHGEGTVTCGNGKIIHLNPLFQNDKPIHLQSMCSLKNRTYFEIPKEVVSNPVALFKESTTKVKTSSTPTVKNSSKRYDSFVEFDETSGKQSRSTKEFPKVPHLNPVEIPLQKTLDGIDISYLINKISERSNKSQDSEFDFFLKKSKFILESSAQDIKLDVSTEVDDFGCSSPTETSSTQADEFLITQFEERELRNTLIRLFPQLRALYDTYASITSPKNINFSPIMIRMYLWQFYIDVGIYSKGYSLIQTDEMLANWPGSGLKSVHGPFEKIYKFQFLSSLLLISFDMYESQYRVTEAKRGIMAFTLTKFMENDVLPNAGKHLGWALFDFRDLLPIHSTYVLYRTYGRPITARQFLRSCCVRKNHSPPEYLKVKEGEKSGTVGRGKKNIVLHCNRIIYCRTQLKDVVLTPPEEEIEIPDLPFFSDPFRTELFVLRSLGPATVTKCLTEVCPLIMDSGLIVNMEYPLTFLEFYNVLLLCVFKLIDKELKKLEKKRKREEMEQQKEQQNEEPPAEFENPSLVLPKIKGLKKEKKGSK